MVNGTHAEWRDGIFREVRELIRENTALFEQAGRRLDELYTEESIRAGRDEEDEFSGKLAVKETPEQLLFMRLEAALTVLRYPDFFPYNNHLDFLSSDTSEERRLAARMAILVMLAAADPEKSEVVTEPMGAISTIPYEIEEIVQGKKKLAPGGSSWILWREDGWDEQNEPSPRLLKHLEHAIRVARKGNSDAPLKNGASHIDGTPERMPQKQQVTQTVTKATVSRGMTVDQARMKAESIARKQGWPVYRDAPSINAMATRVGCSYHTMNKAKEDSNVLKYHYDKAFARLSLPAETDREKQIRMLAHEQEADDNRQRV